MWLLPVPELPSAMIFSRRSTYSERASSITNALFKDGSAAKSKLSRLFTVGNLAALMRRWIADKPRPPRGAADCDRQGPQLDRRVDARSSDEFRRDRPPGRKGRAAHPAAGAAGLPLPPDRCGPP